MGTVDYEPSFAVQTWLLTDKILRRACLEHLVQQEAARRRPWWCPSLIVRTQISPNRFCEKFRPLPDVLYHFDRRFTNSENFGSEMADYFSFEF
jgi:hypothetical protein